MATWETGTTNLGIAFRQSFWSPNIGKKLPFCPPEMTVPILEPNRFQIAADALEMSLEVNDRAIFEHVKNTYYTEYADECQIGFAAKAQAPRNRTIIRNLQLRRLPGPVEKPAPKPPRKPLERGRVSPIALP